MNKRDIYFYSSNCQFCKKLDGLLSSLPVKFVRINVEKYPRKNLPNFLEVVPTLVLRDGNIIKGRNAIEWASMFSRGSASNNQQQPSQTNQSNNNRNNNSTEEIKPVHTNEMFGFSDSFSFLGGDNQQPDTIDHSFSFLNSNSSDNLGDFRPSDTRNNSSNDLDRAYENLMEERRKDMKI